MTASVSPPPVEVEPRLHDRTPDRQRRLQGLRMTGWRIGYARRPRAADQGDGHAPVAVHLQPDLDRQWAAVEALTGPQDFIAANNARLQGAARPGRRACSTRPRHLPARRRRAHSTSSLLCRRRSAAPRRAARSIGDDEDFATELLGAEGVAVVHGAAFGMSPYFRISYATATAALEDACQRVQRFCAGLR